MALTSGTKLGPYEILAPLGAGGMGEVYRARDTRLDRTVAIKILPSHLSDNPEAKNRFDREARVISSLNHPHICTLHDVGHQDGIDFLVMEYLEGESLDHRLQKGPLPLKQALECGLQIADALERAHRAGIVHRDLKPANIVLTASGAKLLDFGLAKPAAAVLSPNASPELGGLTPSTPTVSLSVLSAPAGALTQKGTMVGTFQYMAPELLRGQEADTRSDLFSLGCVLYEMLTGRRAFEGKTQLSVLTAILEKDPDPVSAVQPTTPPALDYTVQTCLEKNPDDRFQSAHDVKLQLTWITKSGSQAGTTAVGESERKASRSLTVGIAAVLAIAALGFAARWWRTQPVPRVIRSNLLPPAGTHFAPFYRNGPAALSPDGTRIAFVASRDGKTSIWVRALDKLEASELPETEGGYFPFWSPDGSSVGFFAHGRLWRMDANGGSTVAICNVDEGRGATWGSSNLIVLAPHGEGPFMRVSAQGGTPIAVTSTVRNAIYDSDRWPFFLPDGKHFLYLHSLLGTGDDRNEIRFASVDGTTNKLLLKGRYYLPEYASRWLLVGHAGALTAQRFDPSSGSLSGDAVTLTNELQIDDNVGSSLFSVSQNGVLAYLQGTGRGAAAHAWFDATGRKLAQASELGLYGATRLSPDGTKFAAEEFESVGQVNIWVWDITHGTRARVSSGGRNADTPVFSSDGRTLYFAYTPVEGHLHVYQRPVDGSREQQLLFATDTDSLPTDVTHDGKWLLYLDALRDSPHYAALKAYPLAGGTKSAVIVEQVDDFSNAALMPGTNEWLAYQSSESGREEIYLTRFPNSGAKYQVGEGTEPLWSKDGKHLYYLDSGLKLTTVDIRSDKDSVQVGAPRTLFQTTVMTANSGTGYAVTGDGRFLVLNSVIETPSPLTLVTNWDTELTK
jgi:eukaryotic-like serine/threonine-protein kinase